MCLSPQVLTPGRQYLPDSRGAAAGPSWDQIPRPAFREDSEGGPLACAQAQSGYLGGRHWEGQHRPQNAEPWAIVLPRPLAGRGRSNNPSVNKGLVEVR